MKMQSKNLDNTLLTDTKWLTWCLQTKNVKIMDKLKNENGQKVTKEMVIEWVKRDLVASHYFLGVLLRYPEVMQSCAEQIYEHAMKREGGAAIDHTSKPESVKNDH